MMRASQTTAMVVLAAAFLAAQDTPMSRQCEREVVELHQFFEDWFNGKLDDTEAEFRRFDGVMATDFEIIGPDGRSSSRDGIIARLQGSHGFQADAEKPMRIWIENLRSRPLENGYQLVTYEEWQETAGVTRGRLSTAIFSAKAGAPHGVQWHHVHETWLPEN